MVRGADTSRIYSDFNRTWYFAGFLGNLFAGWLGTLWMPLSHSAFFALLGAIALASAGLLGLCVIRVTCAERSLR